MSILSHYTEPRVLLTLVKILKCFENLDQFKISNEDAFVIRSAENLIKGTIESNGYRVVTEQDKATRIPKDNFNQNKYGKDRNQ